MAPDSAGLAGLPHVATLPHHQHLRRQDEQQQHQQQQRPRGKVRDWIWWS
jgi:hypothetical protein